MDVLNTYGGETNVLIVVLSVMAGIIAICAFIECVEKNEGFLAVLGILFGILTIFGVLSAHEPVRHEVTLRPGHVIDATKYEIIEQRGQIYVIEEREVSGE